MLFPAVGMVLPVFDTQIAAALAGHPAQVGYAELARRLLGVELAKAHTRADWSRRPLSAEEQEYALDDVRHLAALRASLLDTLGGERPPRLARGRAGGARQSRRVARRARGGVEEGQGPAGTGSAPPAAGAGARRLARTARRRTQPAARLDPRRCQPARDRRCGCRARSRRSRRCRKCRNRWCASAARNCWRWCATPASPTHRRRCPSRTPRSCAAGAGETPGRHRRRSREEPGDQLRGAGNASRARKARRRQARRQPAARLAQGNRRREIVSGALTCRACGRATRFAVRARPCFARRALLLRLARGWPALRGLALRRTTLRARALAFLRAARRLAARFLRSCDGAGFAGLRRAHRAGAA